MSKLQLNCIKTGTILKWDIICVAVIAIFSWMGHPLLFDNSFAASAWAQEVDGSISDRLVVISRSSSASTVDLEYVVEGFRSSRKFDILKDNLNWEIGCIMSISDDVLRRVKSQKSVKSVSTAFADFPIFAIFQVNGDTILKINAGRQVWTADGGVSEYSQADFRFIEGMLIGLKLEKGCLQIGQP